MVDGSARPKKTFGRKIKSHDEDISTLYSLIGDGGSGVGGGTRGNIVGGGSPGISEGRFLPLDGGTMEGTIGHISEALAIDTGNLKLSENAAGDQIKIRKNIFVSPETPTTDDLDTIEGRVRPGQEIRLVGIAGNTITIKHNNTGAESGNESAIICPGAMDYVITDTDAVDLFYDDVNLKWRITGDATSGGPGGSGTDFDYGVDRQGTKTGTVTHNLATEITRHKLQFTATGDCDITLSNIPTGATNALDFYIEIIQDMTGGHVITFNDSEVLNPPTPTTTADTTTLLACHADGDGNIRIVTLLNAAPSSGGFADKDLNNLVTPILNTPINFNSNAPTNFNGYVSQIIGNTLVNDISGATWTLPSGDAYLYNISGVEEFSVSAGNINLKDNGMTNYIGWTADVGQTEVVSTTGIALTLPLGDTWDITIDSKQVAVISKSGWAFDAALAGDTFNMNSHKIINVTDPTLAQDVATKAYVDAFTSFSDKILEGNSSVEVVDAGTGSIVFTADAVSQGTITNGVGWSIDNNVSINSTNTFFANGISTFNDVVKIDSGNYIRSNDATECGFFVTNASSGVGTKGSIQIPVDTASVGSAANADSDFGSEVGCIGIYLNSGGNPTLVVKIDASPNTWATMTIPTTGNISAGRLT